MKTYNIYCGLDPGLTGYIAVLNKDGNFVETYKTPIITTTKTVTKRKTGEKSSSSKTILDEDALVTYLNNLIKKYGIDNILLCIEKQHPMPKQGLASTSKTMYGYGFMIGLLRGMGMNFEITTARNWQKAILDHNEEDTKKASVDYVLGWNKDIDLKKTKKSRINDHNMADSICLARFIYLKSTGEVSYDEK